MENRMNYTKAILFLVSGIISIATTYMLGTESEFYGFLTGFGYTAVVGGLVGILYTYFKNQKEKKSETVH